MLKLNDVSVALGGYRILEKISLEIKQGECVALLGNNGSGKSTLFRTVAGITKPSGGTIEFKGEPIHRLPADKIVCRGLVLCPEGRRLFPQLSVYKNLRLGAYVRKCSAAELHKTLDQNYELFPILKERKDQLAGTLSGGEQQMLAIARSLMCEPSFLLMDEPSMGLAPKVVQKIAETVKTICEMGTTVFLSEQNANMALQVTNRGYVLESGTIMLEGASSDLADNDLVRKAYLGA
ncbi:MAG: ABC transporter ATP-binding protein [Dethiobacter sp.]|nr:ABC transporter ATP-binding protein [Dethiobacter sp.]